MRSKPFWNTLLVLLVAILSSACDQKTVYNKYHHISIQGWERQDTMTYDIPHINMSGKYEEQVGVRILQTFPFTNVSILIQQTVFPAMTSHYDTLVCRFMDNRGKIDGNGISYYQYIFPLKKIALENGYSLHVSIHHIMKRETLPGLTDIGFKLIAE